MTAVLELEREIQTAIRRGICIRAPYGCGQQIRGFRNWESKREYRFSALCQQCQNREFDRGEVGR